MNQTSQCQLRESFLEKSIPRQAHLAAITHGMVCRHGSVSKAMVSFPRVHACLSQHHSVLHPSPVFTIQRGYNYSRRRLSSQIRNCCPLGTLERGWEGVLPVLAFYFQGIRKLCSFKSQSVQIYHRSEHCLIIYLISDQMTVC